MSTYQKLENNQAQVKVEVESSLWLSAQTKAFEKLAKKVTVKGFRKGKAPKHLVKKQLSEKEVLLEAADSLMQEELMKAVDEHEIEIIDRPSVSVEEISEEKLTLVFDLTVSPTVELKQYKGLGYQVPQLYVLEDEVKAEVERMRERASNLELKEDGVVENGDTCVIDFEGFKDGVAFEGGKAENYSLVIGSKSFIPGFEDGLLGLKANDEKELELTFPENYQAEHLKGQKVVFKVKVNEIKTKVLPELNDDFVQELDLEGVDNLEQLNAYAHDKLLKQKTQAETQKLDEEVINKLISANDFEVPAVMVERESKEMLNEFSNRLAQQGMTLSNYFQMTGLTEEQFLKDYSEEASKRVKVRLIFKAIAKKEDFKVLDEEVEKEYQRYAEMYKISVEEIKKYLRYEDIQEDLKFNKVFNFIKEN